MCGRIALSWDREDQSDDYLLDAAGTSARVGWRPGRGDYRERRKEGKVWYGAGKLPEVGGGRVKG